jgi:hypothetical protein
MRLFSSFFNRQEILFIWKRWKQICQDKLGKDKTITTHTTLKAPVVAEGLDELKLNPFRLRMIQIFCNQTAHTLLVIFYVIASII